MNKRNLIIVILFMQLHTVFSQTKDSLSMVEVGIGTGYTNSAHGAVNVGYSLSFNNILASFMEYNMFFDKEEILFHEVNVKFGPYIKFDKNSYFAMSTGLSYMFHSSITGKQSGYSVSTVNQDNNLISVPFQVKLNVGIYDKLSFGIKGTFNKMIKENIENKSSFLIYLALSI
jgi:hypothetical protein